MTIENQIRRALRQMVGLSLYRAGAYFVLLLCGFAAFPQQKAVVALAVIVFNLGLAAMMEFQRFTSLVESSVSDRAERKTRHTIVLAQQRSLRGEPCDDYLFWREVDDRVAAELGGEDVAPPWWKSAGLTVWNIGGRLLGDLVTVFFALLVSGNL